MTATAVTQVLSLPEVGLREARERVAYTLRSGELVVVPSDTVYAVLADVTNPDAMERLFTVRQADRAAPPAVLLHNAHAVLGLAREVPDAAERLMAAYWPGPLTLVFQAKEDLDWHLGERRDALSIRMPAEPLLLQVCNDVGALASSAASRAGEPPPTTLAEARARLGDGVALYVDDGPRDASPSAVVDVTRGGAEVLREGAISAEDLAATAGSPEGLPEQERVPETGQEPEGLEAK